MVLHTERKHILWEAYKISNESGVKGTCLLETAGIIY